MVIDILRFFGVRCEFIWGKVSAIETGTALNKGIPCKRLKITHNLLPFLFYYHFWFNFSLFQGPQRLYLIILRYFWIKRWGYLGKNVSHLGSYGLKQGNPLQNLKSLQLPNIFILLSFFGSHKTSEKSKC